MAYTIRGTNDPKVHSYSIARVLSEHACESDLYRYFAGLIVGCLRGASKEELLFVRYSPLPGYWDQNPMVLILLTHALHTHTLFWVLLGPLLLAKLST